MTEARDVTQGPRSADRPGDERDALRHALEETSRNQSLAADPETSVWVGANAGTGKTHVLTNRVLRLLVCGTAPEKILCLTYTKAAAALMSRRVFDRLASWVVMTDEALDASLADLTGKVATPETRDFARSLFALAIETPGGLKVQTIHAFCERLLQRFPLEANIAPNFSILDDQAARALLRQATDLVLTRATRKGGRQSPLGQAVREAVAFASDERFEQLVFELSGLRTPLGRIVGQYTQDRNEDEPDGDPFGALTDDLKTALGVRPGATEAELVAECSGVLGDDVLDRVISALRDGKKTDVSAADTLEKALRAPNAQVRAQFLGDALLTKDGTAQKRMPTKAVIERFPDVVAALERAKARLVALNEELGGLRIAIASLAFMRLGGKFWNDMSGSKPGAALSTMVT